MVCSRTGMTSSFMKLISLVSSMIWSSWACSLGSFSSSGLSFEKSEYFCLIWFFWFLTVCIWSLMVCISESRSSGSSEVFAGKLLELSSCWAASISFSRICIWSLYSLLLFLMLRVSPCMTLNLTSSLSKSSVIPSIFLILIHTISMKFLGWIDASCPTWGLKFANSAVIISVKNTERSSLKACQVSWLWSSAKSGLSCTRSPHFLLISRKLFMRGSETQVASISCFKL
mmetsp:Transcript_10569/g.15827  ORF Transcript_10569/g.15827 Transcript_10569/m.15827 type:complete len:229 (-) Transcript_10569:646-1332(-)